MDEPTTYPNANVDWVRALQRTAKIVPSGSRTLAQIVDATAATDPDRTALIGEDDALSYGELAELSLRVAKWALSLGLQKGDRVALLMANAPVYPAIWIGLSRVGVVTALINTHLSGVGLRHCLAEASAKHLIVDEGGALAMRGSAIGEFEVWVFGASDDGSRSLDRDLAHQDPCHLDDVAAHAPVLRDPALLIFTSGTTGLPKAAHVSHYRTVMWSEWFAGIMDAKEDDRLYDCLPMYHSIGGVVAVGAMLAAGGAIIVRRTFSAGVFWQDLADTRATIFQYIGELCRFLNGTPPGEASRRHALRLVCGNGLREDVWRAFVASFAVPRVIEFYAATEGSFSLFNLEGRPGAIGRVPGFMAHRSPVALVRVDPATEQPVRDADGLCLRCRSDEPGEAIGLLAGGTVESGLRFEGYTSADATERKILRDVFARGDAWYRTGDLMKRDAQGFYFFVDRLGDTFRWKGENVSTTEVAAVLCAAPGVVDAAVYGVEIPGAEGRAGMAALVTDPGFSLASLHARVAAELPRYARPCILRLCHDLALTGTFRPRKADLKAAGFDPSLSDDPLFLDHEGSYTRLDAMLHARLAAGTLRL